ncbi:MAG: two-component system, chemotaxis family, sensor kinase CheA, partial [Betaproteobacteria bacterium]
MKQPGTRSKEEAFLQQLRATFKIEAQEHLQTISAGLLELEKTRGRDKQLTLVETVFRAAHSLKGAARAVDFTRIESLCQSLEDVFATWKREKTAPSAEALDALHRTLDAITSALAAAGNSDAVGKALESAPSREPSTEPGPAAPP